MTLSARLAVLLGLACLCWPTSGMTQELPTCSAERAGQRLCRAGNICICRTTGGTMQGMPLALRWDCQIGNGNCIEGQYQALAPYPFTPTPAREARLKPPAAPEAGAARAQMIELQKALARQGFDPGPAAGVFGPRTRAALNGFQRREHLPVTERPSPEALARLKGNG